MRRLPADQVGGFGIVAPEPLHLGRVGTQACVLGLDADLDAHQVGDCLRRLANRDLEIGAQVHNLTHRAIRARRCDETVDRIGHR